MPFPYNVILGRDTALPSPLYYSGIAGIDITTNLFASELILPKIRTRHCRVPTMLFSVLCIHKNDRRKLTLTCTLHDSQIISPGFDRRRSDACACIQLSSSVASPVGS